MKLSVEDILAIVSRVQKILQCYQGKAKGLDEVLDDIYLHCCESDRIKQDYLPVMPEREQKDLGIGDKSAAAKKTSKSAARKKKAKLESTEDFLLLQGKLRSSEREQAEELLMGYTIKGLCAFADYFSISVRKSGNKPEIVGQICGHYGFRNLNTKMGQRPNMER